MTTSPAQRMINSRTRTLLPVHSHLLDPEITNEKEVPIKVKTKKATRSTMRIMYNKGPKPLETLKIGDTVRMKPI